MTQTITKYILLTCGLLFGVIAVPVEVTPALSNLLQGCAGCHGKDGVSTVSSIPVIAGYSAQYMIDSMTAYKLGERPSATMGLLAKNLKDDEIESIAEFFAAKKFIPRQQEFNTAKAKLGQKIHSRYCFKCHEDGGRSPDDDAGILGGQWMPYLQYSFKEYTSGDRLMPENMKRKFDKLTPSDIESLIHYYVSLQ